MEQLMNSVMTILRDKATAPSPNQEQGRPDTYLGVTAATMGYLFTPTSDSQQIGSLTYPEDIRTQLGLRQDLRFGHARFSPGDVETLSNGELIFKNTTGDIPPKHHRRHSSKKEKAVWHGPKALTGPHTLTG